MDAFKWMSALIGAMIAIVVGVSLIPAIMSSMEAPLEETVVVVEEVTPEVVPTRGIDTGQQTEEEGIPGIFYAITLPITIGLIAYSTLKWIIRRNDREALHTFARGHKEKAKLSIFGFKIK